MIVSGGNFSTELDELELGRRVTIQLDAENNCWGAVTMYWWLTDDAGFDLPSVDDGTDFDLIEDWSAVDQWDDLEDWDEGLA